ncbi:hypothetical protein SAMD00019534_087950 [Acytostelium subglobosum LB1]|uniref:hypothetical protein n=1 Tax=Acytostelium subglobosum LB1 TaxID=1410327 RepID=UPI000644C364|nr:hypothetical protein SAMD00019534_087950 [Acytostelium subglobosum LB1]GAM25620.1 hypothetical protein SAMD00019534_087950 [Acytostelium subglobosum LB1]|eukprot:XP_012751606.1 hypothetical protein SAMD00019534_087950 [Acytostelium subglobosum LB1]
MAFIRANFMADSNSLLIVCEEKITTFNVETMDSDYNYIPSETDPDAIHYIHSSCFDGQDSIYLMTSIGDIDDDEDIFMRYSLSTRKITKLAKSPISSDYSRLIHDQSFGIIYVGGKGRNYRYSIPDDKWTLITDDNDSITNRAQYGACLIRD